MAGLSESASPKVFPMVMLYLVVRTLLPLLAFVLAWWWLARLINARGARLPRVPLNLPEHSSSPRRKDRRSYARALRRRPGLRTATRAATAPRSWHVAAAILSLLVLIATVLAIPDCARFQVMMGNLIGYPSALIEVRAPRGRTADGAAGVAARTRPAGAAHSDALPDRPHRWRA